MKVIEPGDKILVSGAGGFVGNVLIRDLITRGYKVRAVDNFHKGQCDSLLSLIPYRSFEFMYGDITRESDVQKMYEDIDGVIHLAAIVGFPACEKHPSLAEATNVGGTKNLLKFRPKGLPFVFASTGSVFGAITDGVCTEDSPLNAVSRYGVNKKVAEDMVSQVDNSVSFRFATGFGVSANMRVNLLVNDLVYRAITHKCINIFQADFRRTFISVQDMSRCFIFGLENVNVLKHKVYNAGDNNLNWTKRELADYIGEQTGCIVHYADFGSDADLRDYEVSYERLNGEGFKTIDTMEKGIAQLIKATPLLQIRHQYE